MYIILYALNYSLFCTIKSMESLVLRIFRLTEVGGKVSTENELQARKHLKDNLIINCYIFFCLFFLVGAETPHRENI